MSKRGQVFFLGCCCCCCDISSRFLTATGWSCCCCCCCCCCYSSTLSPLAPSSSRTRAHSPDSPSLLLFSFLFKHFSTHSLTVSFSFFFSFLSSRTNERMNERTNERNSRIGAHSLVAPPCNWVAAALPLCQRLCASVCVCVRTRDMTAAAETWINIANGLLLLLLRVFVSQWFLHHFGLFFPLFVVGPR